MGLQESDMTKQLNNEAVLAEFPRWLRRKESTCNAGDMGLIPGLGRSLEVGNGNRSLAGYPVSGVPKYE